MATLRVDLDHGAIELLECHAIRFGKPFRPELFRAFSDEETLTTILVTSGAGASAPLPTTR